VTLVGPTEPAEKFPAADTLAVTRQAVVLLVMVTTPRLFVQPPLVL
jgi:hypothetical protein